jgi:transposase-like protein
MRDKRGRSVVPAEERRRMVAACETGRMTMAELAPREYTNFGTLAGWINRKGLIERGVRAGAIEFSKGYAPASSAPRYSRDRR